MRPTPSPLTRSRWFLAAAATIAGVLLPVEPPPATAATATPQCTITGTPGDDVLRGTGRADVICGLGGNDVIIGKGGNDTLVGGAGNDRLEGGAGADLLIGEAGRDTLVGGAHSDRFIGGGGADRLTAGTTGDTCAVDPADPVTGSCAADTTGPLISDVQIPAELNAGETLTVTWRVTDPSGIDTIGGGANTWAALGGTPGYLEWCGFPIEPTLISGNSTDGVYRISCQLPALAPAGTYSVVLSAIDVFGNGIDGFFRFVDFDVRNDGFSDSNGPGVSELSALAESYVPGGEVNFTLRATDETAVTGVDVFVLGPNGDVVDSTQNGWIVDSTTTLTSGTAQDGTYTVRIVLADTAIPGSYQFLIGAVDPIGNRTWLTVGDPSITVR